MSDELVNQSNYPNPVVELDLPALRELIDAGDLLARMLEVESARSVAREVYVPTPAIKRWRMAVAAIGEE